jgi:hypothetical protein
MQGFERMDRQHTDAAAPGRDPVPAGSIFAFLAAHRAGFPPTPITRTCSPGRGADWPSLSATQMAAVLALHDYSDPGDPEAARFGVR